MKKVDLLKVTTIVKWVTIGLLILPLILYYFPYRKDISGFDMVRLAQAAGNGWQVEMFLRILLPIIFSVIAGLILVKLNIVTAIISLILCLINRGIYSAYVSSYRGFGRGTAFGLEVMNALNIICILLCIALLVLTIIQMVKKKPQPTQQA